MDDVREDIDSLFRRLGRTEARVAELEQRIARLEGAQSVQLALVKSEDSKAA